jgi:hypothetical protein
MARLTCPWVLGFVITLVGCREREQTDADFGSVKNSVYRNEYFGLTLGFPAGWTILDQEAQQQRTQRGVSALAGNDRALQKQLKASEMQSVPLFAAHKHPLGSPPPNPSISGIAERVEPRVRRGSDYLARAKEVLKSGQMTVSFPKEVYQQKLDGVDFDVLELEIFIDGSKAKQKQYCTIAKGYALAFVICFNTDEDESLLADIIKTVRFQKKAVSQDSSGKVVPVSP